MASLQKGALSVKSNDEIKKFSAFSWKKTDISSHALENHEARDPVHAVSGDGKETVH
jgi:hypothetical protein